MPLIIGRDDGMRSRIGGDEAEGGREREVGGSRYFSPFIFFFSFKGAFDSLDWKW